MQDAILLGDRDRCAETGDWVHSSRWCSITVTRLADTRGSAGVSGDDRFMSGKADETRPEIGEDPDGLRSKSTAQ
jgi:hypothetical protein